MNTEFPVFYIGQDAAAHLVHYCQSNNLRQFVLVADSNTYEALGRTVERALKEQDYDLITVVLTGDEVVADEHYLMQVLLRADPKERTYLAVGSGTLTDITRFISHRTKTSFISLPTAPSVDGFTSVGAPLIIEGLKQTIITHAPIALFADLDTLAAAPRPLIAAGFGDMLGKYTSLADWRLGHLLWDEPYDEQVAERTRRGIQLCVDHTVEIGQGSVAGVEKLMLGLIESGFAMLQFGSSRPASGAEHHLSHYWEMKLLNEGRRALLHGAKVGVATLWVVERYKQIGQLTREQVIERLEAATLLDRAQEIETIHTAYGSIAGLVIADQSSFLNLPAEKFGLLKEKIIDLWPEIQALATNLPAPSELARMLDLVGGPTSTQALGLSDEEVALAKQYSHYLRDRFTIMKLARVLGI